MIVEKPSTSVNGPGAPSGPSHPLAAPHPLAMEPEAMRALGYQAVDALVERWAGLAELSPREGGSRAEMDALPGVGQGAPGAGVGPQAALAEAVERILPQSARVDHPGFMAYIPSAPTWPSVVADFLATGFNVFQGTWQAAAGPTRIELEVVEWFRGWLGLPRGTSGLFTSGGSAANAMAVVTAREAAFRAAGSPAEPSAFRPSVVFSDQGHSSLVRAARLAGIHPEGIRVLPTGADLRMDPGALREALAADRASGWTPVLVGASGGATSTGVVDPLAELAAVAREAGVHLHVDAAYGGFAALVPEGARALEGIGLADSVTLDPHKWLFQPFECGCLLVREPDSLRQAWRVTPEYLQDTLRGDDEPNPGELGLQLTRSFRALKVWMSVRALGLDAFREAVQRGLDGARLAEARIRSSEVLELVTPASLGIVSWAVRTPGDPAPLHRQIQEVLAAEKLAFLSSTRIRGRDALRLCILNPAVDPARIEALLARAEEVAAQA
jgi:aromatic-L-amino-acid decarboxylase